MRPALTRFTVHSCGLMVLYSIYSSMVVDSRPKTDDLIFHDDFNATIGTDRNGFESCFDRVQADKVGKLTTAIQPLLCNCSPEQ